MKTRLARPEDLAELCALIEDYAQQGVLLPRASDEVRMHLERFVVLTETVQTETGAREERLRGCVALEPYDADLAEVRSLAIASESRGRGLGGKLLEAALTMARRRKIARVFAVTHEANFFERHGFRTAPREAVPEKIARDCRTCTKARDCTLVTVVAVVCSNRDALPMLTPDKVFAIL